MIEASLNPVEHSKRAQFQWLYNIFFRPRNTFAQISSQSRSMWLLPLLVISLTAMINIGVSGRIKQIAAQTGEIQLPPDFQYYTPEQQAQFMQAAAATSGPAFVYAIPSLGRLVLIWGGWLFVGGLLHLILTMLGGRGDTRTTLNIVAWAGMPFALRNLVQVIAILVSDQLIHSPGLSGFAPTEISQLNLYLKNLLALIDIYLIWHIVLLGIGTHNMVGLSARKAWGAIVIIMISLLALQALIYFGIAQLGGLKVVRPFMF